MNNYSVITVKYSSMDHSVEDTDVGSNDRKGKEGLNIS